MAKKNMPPIVEAIAFGYGDLNGKPHRLLGFRVEGQTPGEIRQVAAAIETFVPSYNEFDGRKVAAALRRLVELDALHAAAFGREGSPVLCPWAMLGKEAIVSAEMRALHPDEIDESSNRMRFWWD